MVKGLLLLPPPLPLPPFLLRYGVKIADDGDSSRWPSSLSLLFREITGRDSSSSAGGQKSCTCLETHFPTMYRVLVFVVRVRLSTRLSRSTYFGSRIRDHRKYLALGKIDRSDDFELTFGTLVKVLLMPRGISLLEAHRTRVQDTERYR